MQFLVDFGVQNGAKKYSTQDFFGYIFGFENTFRFCVVLGRLQDGPRGAQEAPGSPQERPKRPQEASKSAPGGPKRPQEIPRTGQEGSKPTQELRRASQDAHKAFPKHLARQPFSENSKNSKHGSKRHRPSLRSPVSMNPKGLAPTRRMKKGGRAAVIPLGEVNPPPPEGSERV